MIGSLSADLPIRTTKGSALNRKIAFSPSRINSAPSLGKPNASHALARTPQASDDVNAAVEDSPIGIP
jgi:hypothetical protein